MNQQELVLTIAAAVGTMIGYLLKRWPNFKTRATPIVILALAVLKNVLVAAGLLPAEVALFQGPASELTGFALAGFASPAVLGWLALLLASWFEMTAAVGTHSALKNLVQAKRDTRPLISKANAQPRIR